MKCSGQIQEKNNVTISRRTLVDTSYYSPQEANNPTRPQHYREMKPELAQEVVDYLVNLGYAVLHIGLPTEPQLQNCLRLSDKDPMNPRYIFALLNKCQYGKQGIMHISTLQQTKYVHV